MCFKSILSYLFLYQVDEYVDILTTLIHDPEYAREIGMRARRHIISNHHLDQTVQQLKVEFCKAAHVHSVSASLYGSQMSRDNSLEMATLSLEYQRLCDQVIAQWLHQQELKNAPKVQQQPAVSPSPAGPTPGTASPSPPVLDTSSSDAALGAMMLRNVSQQGLHNLRVVSDVLKEKQTYDPNMRLTLLTQEKQNRRHRPKTIIKDFNFNSFFRVGNDNIRDWVESHPYMYPQQENVAWLKNVFIAPGKSATIFDANRSFVIQVGEKTMYTPPPSHTPQCKVVAIRKLVSVVQMYNVYGHFLSEQLPRLALVADRIQDDTAIKILIPDLETARSVFTQILNITADRLVTYKVSEPTESCTTYFVKDMYMVSSTPTGHPSSELYDSMRRDLFSSLPNTIFAHHHDHPATTRTIVFLRRDSNANERRITNEEELLAKIRDTFPSYDLIVLHRDNIAYIASMMWRAGLVVGMTGHNLAPVVFARPGTPLVEIMPENPWVHGWGVWTALGLDHWFVPVMGYQHASKDITVPVDMVVQTMTAALEAHATTTT
eukprot:TRINITY_DN9491_c0_g1_i7.p2 TRINITY_DN9491_c0_g1~~TRINITY_DN9491_c0_g1_i7.p2  ORF type:complete len:547 (+),score=84.53 TRINITY_DN9491_c0_g1_i7:1701-3341(+)